jgi:nucleoside-diphosphate-sugar epimerase
MSTKIGITGRTGSLGKEIVKSKKGFNYSFFKGDIRDRNKVFKWINNKKFDAIIHLAAIVPIKVVNSNKKKANDINYIGTKNVVDIVKKNNVKWFFFSSTSHVYASSVNKISEKSKIAPVSYYGNTKLLAERYVVKQLKKSNTTYCIGRIFSTTNKNQKKNYLVPDLKNKMKKAKNKITLHNLNHYRDFISMKDITEIIFHLYKIKFNGIINIGSGNGIYLKDIAIYISNYYKKIIEFKDNKKRSYLVANINKLKKIYKKKLIKDFKKLIF